MPYPADYGGVIDVFYRIKALYEIGVKIHLHCFEYGRGKQTQLNKYCVEVNYYKRNIGLSGFSFRLPYIVQSRARKDLLENLLKDKYPVLLEGIHCTYFLVSDQLKDKNVFVRLHNVEFKYYRKLADNESSFFKKIYFKNESRLLREYEKMIANKSTLLAISKRDAEEYQTLFGATDIKYLPAFLSNTSVTSIKGKGDFCLYHGNLSVVENEKAVLWLCRNVFNQLNIPFMIAGKDPSEKLKKAVSRNKNISLISNPSEERMNELINNAQINILPSFNSTGIKLKLLTALFDGRHCVVNQQAMVGAELESLCNLAETPEEFKAVIQRLYDQPFSQAEIEKRSEFLQKEFDNKRNAETLMQLIC